MSSWRNDLVNDDVDHISAKTREKAMTLAESAKGIGLDPGGMRFNSTEDFMSFWFTNGLCYIIVFCTPDGYMAEVHKTKDGVVAPEYTMPKNIRNFLFYIKKLGLSSFDDYFADLAELADMDDAEIKDIVQQLMDEDSED